MLCILAERMNEVDVQLLLLEGLARGVANVLSQVCSQLGLQIITCYWQARNVFLQIASMAKSTAAAQMQAVESDQRATRAALENNSRRHQGAGEEAA